MKALENLLLLLDPPTSKTSPDLWRCPTHTYTHTLSSGNLRILHVKQLHFPKTMNFHSCTYRLPIYSLSLSLSLSLCILVMKSNGIKRKHCKTVKLNIKPKQYSPTETSRHKIFNKREMWQICF